MNNPNLTQQAKMLDRAADNLEAEAARLRQSAELLRVSGAVIDPLMRAVEAIGKDAQ